MIPLRSALGALRRRGRLSAPAPPLSRLLLGELRWAIGEAVHPVKMLAAALVVIGVGAVLGPQTPGPVLGAGWRLAVAVVLGFVALAMAHRLLQRPVEDEDDAALGPLRVIVAVVAISLVGALALGLLLAVVAGAPTGSTQVPLDSSLPIDAGLLAVAGLLAAGVLAAGLGHRFAIPGALVFLGLGMAIGTDGLGWVDLQDAASVQSISVVALVVILFDGGLSTSPRRLRLGAGPGLAMATVGVAVTAGVTAVGTMALFDVPSRVAWLVGAIVASTDAAAVFAMLRRTPIPERLSSLLQIESGANDPIAVLLTVGLLAAWDAPPTAGEWLTFGAQQLLGGVAAGAAIGWLGSWLLRRVELGTAGLYPILSLAVAGVAYGAATTVGASGFLAVYLCGIVVAAEAPRRRAGNRSVLGALSSGAEVGLFLLLGLLVNPSELVEVAGTALGVTAVLVLVARPLATALCLPWFDFKARDIAVVSWLGLRGAVPIVLATLALSAQIAEADLIFDIVFFVVLTSALVQGATGPGLIRRIGLVVPEGPGRSLIDALPLENSEVDVVEVEVGRDSPLVGRSVRNAPPPQDVVLAAIVRGERVSVPTGASVFRVGDRLVAVTTDRRAGLARIQRWVHEGVTSQTGSTRSAARRDAT